MLQLIILLGVTWAASADLACTAGPSEQAITCFDAHFKPGKVVKIENQTDEMPEISALFLTNVSGTIDSLTFTLFPNIVEAALLFCDFDTFAPNLNLESLEIAESIMPKISSEFFERYGNLSLLSINGNPALKLENGALKSLNNLHALIMYDQRNTHLTSEFLEGLDELDFLHLDTKITRIDEDAFDHLQKLKILEIGFNDFSHLGPSTFSRLPNLEQVHMLGCRKLRTIDWENVFSEQENLVEISFDSRHVKSNTARTLRKIFPKLARVNLEYQKKQSDQVSSFVEQLEKSDIQVRMLLNKA